MTHPHQPLTPKLGTPAERTACLIQATAESLWDISSTILSTGIASASDWEEARAVASRLLLALERPPAPQPSHFPVYRG